METIVWVVHVIAAAGVIGLVLLQHGKGADMGAAFGSGASGSLFGVSGSATSWTLAYLSGHGGKNSSVVKAPATEAPAAKPVDPSVPEAPKAKDVPQ